MYIFILYSMHIPLRQVDLIHLPCFGCSPTRSETNLGLIFSDLLSRYTPIKFSKQNQPHPNTLDRRGHM